MTRNLGLSHSAMYVKDTDDNWIPFSGTILGEVTIDYTNWEELEAANDLVTLIQYNEPNTRGTVSGITYTSAILGLTAYEKFISGTNTLRITRS